VIEMVDAYRARYPQVELSIKLGNSAQSLADLENYVTDVAVASFTDDVRFHAVPYADHAVVLFAHRSHPFYQRDAVSPGRARPAAHAHARAGLHHPPGAGESHAAGRCKPTGGDGNRQS
jgi:DNA-binding transcriptional LysR family regulator